MSELDGLNVIQAHEHVTVSADSLTWMAVHGNLLLSLRHPSNRGPSAELVRAFAAALLEHLVHSGFISPALAEQVRREERDQ